MKHLLLVLAGLLALGGTAAAQAADSNYASPAAYRLQGLRGPEHTRLVRELLRYELRHIHSLIRSEVTLEARTFSFTLRNRATLAEVTGGRYLVSFFDAQGQVLGTTPGHFGSIPPRDSQNGQVRYKPPVGAVAAKLAITDLRAE